jgi:hypothetical protein
LPAKLAHTSLRFWMDTLCCIAGVYDESDFYKKKGIYSMHDITL